MGRFETVWTGRNLALAFLMAGAVGCANVNKSSVASVRAPAKPGNTTTQTPLTDTSSWMGGASSTSFKGPGQYGTLGSPNVSNHPGFRYGSVTWTDATGNLWLYGGFGYDSLAVEGFLNDLWTYSTSSGQWTWVGGSNLANQTGTYGHLGSSASSNVPGGRYNAASWVDKSGKFWLFGGSGLATSSTQGSLNDLWVYDPSARTWAWMSGANAINNAGSYGTEGSGSLSSSPGGRFSSAAWLDQTGNLWLFGGNGSDSNGSQGYLNDLWMYDMASAQWAWISGSKVIGQAGAYGSSPVPGARANTTVWVDSSNTVWMFGGTGLDGTGTAGVLNDLWKYTAGTNQFTWVGGASVINTKGSYATLGQALASNVPGGRGSSNSWIDAEGNLWLFGGVGFDASGLQGALNDLWKYTPANGLWTWMGGANVANQNGTFGVEGTGSASNIPGGRSFSSSWMDTAGNLWLFGGMGFDSIGSQGSSDDLWRYTPTTGQWAWMSGADVIYQNGVYGIQGVASSNNLPGARQNAISWTDASGNQWMFGGNGYDVKGAQGVLNDLWKYSSGQWTWVSGSNLSNQPGMYGSLNSAGPANVPGGRSDAVSWIDATGNLWMFGGNGVDITGTQGALNDLWMFNPSSGQWTWVSGGNEIEQGGTYGAQGVGDVNNMPGSRSDSVAWIDGKGQLWLFGGDGFDSVGSEGDLNDLWSFNPANLQWTWVAGSNVANANGSYGAQGSAAASNAPGARSSAVGWADASGNFWLFGGMGFDSVGSQNQLNDLWMYSPASGQWTWESGAVIADQVGTYGQQGTAGVANTPGSRASSIAWIDGSGTLWLFGGQGYDASGIFGDLNDLWSYSPSTGQWTWVKGTNGANAAGVYGAQGSGSASNFPGGRYGACSWIDSSGNLWLFGGFGIDADGAQDMLQDMWQLL